MRRAIITFVVPAYNEEKQIRSAISAIRRYIPREFGYEIIVVDHGSSDRTVMLAEREGVNVFVHSVGTIAALRNYGAQRAKGDVLVFIDADVLLTAAWTRRIVDIVPELVSGKRILTGSWVGIPEKANWIERNWYEPLQKGSNTHINSGHLIISMDLFNELGGFNEELETGEDYEFSMRAKSNGVEVVDDPLLSVIHEGYPKSVREFIRREYWHGKGDAGSIKAIFGSKVAAFAAFFIGLHVVAFMTFLFSHDVNLSVKLILLTLLMTVTVSSVKYRGEGITVILVNTFLYYIYFCARGASLFTVLLKKEARRHER